MAGGTTIVDRLNKLSGKDATTIAKALENVEEAGVGGAADWNENDPEAKGYIANRPFYEGEELLVKANTDYASPYLNINNQNYELFLKNGVYCLEKYSSSGTIQESWLDNWLNNYDKPVSSSPSYYTVFVFECYLWTGSSIIAIFNDDNQMDKVAIAKRYANPNLSIKDVIEYSNKYVTIIVWFTKDESNNLWRVNCDYLINKKRIDDLVQKHGLESAILNTFKINAGHIQPKFIPIPNEYIPEPFEKGKNSQHTKISNNTGFESYYGDNPNRQCLRIYNGHLQVNNQNIRRTLKKAIGALPNYGGLLIADQSLLSSPFFVHYNLQSDFNPTNCFSAIPLSLSTDLPKNGAMAKELDLFVHQIGEPNISSGANLISRTGYASSGINFNVNGETVLLSPLDSWYFEISEKRRYALIKVDDTFRQYFTLCFGNYDHHNGVPWHIDDTINSGSVITYIFMNCCNQNINANNENVYVSLYDPALLHADSDAIL